RSLFAHALLLLRRTRTAQRGCVSRKREVGTRGSGESEPLAPALGEGGFEGAVGGDFEGVEGAGEQAAMPDARAAVEQLAAGEPGRGGRRRGAAVPCAASRGGAAGCGP